MNQNVLRRLELFPSTSTIEAGGLAIGGCNLAALATEYGTPLYVFDAATLNEAAAEYKRTLADAYPGDFGVTYAGKAFLCRAMAQWVQRQGFRLDCTGAGEIAVAVAAGLPRSAILVHGVNKSDEDLQAAVDHAGVIVVDNLLELQRLAKLTAGDPAAAPELWLRIRPGVAVDTHAYRQTGQVDSKFGMGLAEAVEAVQRCQVAGLRLTGLHFHQGSHFHDPAPIGPALETVLDLIEELRSQSGWTPQVLSPGGGWGVPYHEEDLPHPSIKTYVHFVAEALASGCAQRGLPLPQLQLEPGRSLVARAGVAIYRVGAVKQTPARRWLMIDGGMADNPRPALYGAHYTALPVCGLDRPWTGNAWFGGPFCESGDVLIDALPMPDLQPEEFVAVPVSGAYHLAMGSNYNGARRPAVLWLQQGQAHIIQRRETLDELMWRDANLPDAS